MFQLKQCSVKVHEAFLHALLYVSNVLIVRLTGSLSLTIVVFDDGALRE